ncbi:hypothetical protein NDU88_006545 [Pleurodeles waltl]|uniref:Uncharacterized protein n=1 Tax=Pleurodeles waltl TaxID=8319 RepID=A0AAV7N0Q7_PLEWA|nr:hypothetical protein NDU88_006545 [Pleurodeles waltl]
MTQHQIWIHTVALSHPRTCQKWGEKVKLERWNSEDVAHHPEDDFRLQFITLACYNKPDDKYLKVKIQHLRMGAAPHLKHSM